MSEADFTMGAMSGTGTVDRVPAAQNARAGLGERLRGICSFPGMLGGFLVAAVFAMLRTFIFNPDAWWHIKIGDLILSTHHWPTTDPFSYTAAGAPWISCEWLGDVFFATVYRLVGLRGLEALLLVMAFAVILALYEFATLRSGNSKAAFLTSLVLLPLVRPTFSMRPQMLGYLFLILTLIAMERFRQGKQRAVWMLPLLFLIWINTHGSWVIGIGTVGLYLACGLVNFQIGSLEARRWTNSERLRLGTVFMLSLAVIPITPYGTRLAAYPFTFASSWSFALANIAEWQVMPFDAFGGKLFLVLVLGFLMSLAVFRFSWRLEEFLLLLFGITMACVHVRFLMLFVPFFAPLGAVILARWAPEYEKAKDQYLLNFAIMAGIVIAMAHYFPSQSQMEKMVADRYPVHALEYMREHSLTGPIYNSYNFGGYMIESGLKTFIDGRGELFDATGVFADYAQIEHVQPGTLQVMNKYGIRSVLMARGEPLLTFLSYLPDWQKVYSDNASELYVKTDSADVTKRTVAENLRSPSGDTRGLFGR